MNLWDKIENLRNKPEPAKQAIALFLAIAITTIIVGIWIYIKALPESPTSTAEAPSPAKILWNYINDLWK